MDTSINITGETYVVPDMMMNNQLPWPRLWWVLLVPALVAVSSCNPGAEKAVAAQTEEISSLEKTKARLEHELKLLRADIERRESEIIQKNDELLKSNDELKAQLEKAQDEAAKLKREFDDYVSNTRSACDRRPKGSNCLAWKRPSRCSRPSWSER